MKKVIVLTEMDFSAKQGAAYGRILAYSKALEQSHTFYLTSWNSLNNDFEQGNYNLWMSKDYFTHKHSKTFRVFLIQFAFIKAFRYISKVSNQYSKDSIYFIYSHNLALLTICLFYLSWWKKSKVILEKNELDLGILKNIFELYKINKLIFILVFPIRLITSTLIDLISFFFPTKILISYRLLALYKYTFKNYLIPPLVDTSVFIYSPLQKNEKVNILFAGTITLIKDGLVESITAISKLNDFDKSMIEFHIYGNGPVYVKNYLMDMVKKFNLDHVVFFHDNIAFNDMPALYGKHDILLMPRTSNLQNNFGFSTKMVESLACGCPVVVTNVSDNGDYIINFKNSFLITNIKTQTIINILKDIVESKDNLPVIAKEAYELANNYFSIQVNKEKIIQAFEN